MRMPTATLWVIHMNKCTGHFTALLLQVFATSLKQSSYVVLPKVTVGTQSLTFGIDKLKGSLKTYKFYAA